MDINKGTLGVVAAIGIVAGASGALLMTRGGTTAAEPTTETTVAVELHDPGRRPRGARACRGGGAATPAPTPVSPSGRVPPSAPRARDVRQTAAARPAPRRSEAPAPAPASRVRSRRAPQVQSAPAIVPAPAPVEQRASETVPAVEEPKYEDLVLPAQSVIGIQVDRTRVERDGARRGRGRRPRHARRARGRPRGDSAGSRAMGEVTLVERGGTAAGPRAPRHPLHVGRAGRRHARADRDRDDLPRRRRARRRKRGEDRRRRHRRRHPRRHPRRRQGRGHRRLGRRRRRQRPRCWPAAATPRRSPRARRSRCASEAGDGDGREVAVRPQARRPQAARRNPRCPASGSIPDGGQLMTPRGFHAFARLRRSLPRCVAASLLGAGAEERDRPASATTPASTRPSAAAARSTRRRWRR